jgi:hypothetical protein
MSAILLAATQNDGHETMRKRPELVGLVSVIVTPRTFDRVRGYSFEHLFATDAWFEVPDERAFPVTRTVLPALVMSRCEICATGDIHPPIA